MPKLSVSPEDIYFSSEPENWEIGCVKGLGEGCVCWGCESDHQDCFQGDTEECNWEDWDKYKEGADV